MYMNYYILIKKKDLILSSVCVILVILYIIYKNEITKYVKGMLGKKGILRKKKNDAKKILDFFA